MLFPSLPSGLGETRPRAPCFLEQTSETRPCAVCPHPLIYSALWGAAHSAGCPKRHRLGSEALGHSAGHAVDADGQREGPSPSDTARAPASSAGLPWERNKIRWGLRNPSDPVPALVVPCLAGWVKCLWGTLCTDAHPEAPAQKARSPRAPHRQLQGPRLRANPETLGSPQAPPAGPRPGLRAHGHFQTLPETGGPFPSRTTDPPQRPQSH